MCTQLINLLIRLGGPYDFNSSLDGQNNPPTEERCVVRFPPIDLKLFKKVLKKVLTNK